MGCGASSQAPVESTHNVTRMPLVPTQEHMPPMSAMVAELVVHPPSSNASQVAVKEAGNGGIFQAIVASKDMALQGDGGTPEAIVASKGITLRGMRKLRAKIETKLEEGYFKHKYEVDGSWVQGVAETIDDLTTTQLVYALIKEIKNGDDPQDSLRLADNSEWVDPEDVGVPTYFVSHAWKSTVGKLFDSVESFLSNAAEDTIVWIDCVANNQHSANQANKDDTTANAFESVLRTCQGGTIVVVNMEPKWGANPAKRAWCIFEWDHTLLIHGPDGLHMVGLSQADRDQVIQDIDVESANCFAPSDKDMILGKVAEHHGSYQAFNEALKLQLLLQPLTYKVDLVQLRKRSAGTAWRLGVVQEWMQGDSRALCVLAGAGTGKSTISAAICVDLLSKHEKIVSAYHFLKYNDMRRLEPIRILQSLAFQLAKRIPHLAKGLLQLNAVSANNMDTILSLFVEIEQPIIILLDALDEADPPEQQIPGFDGTVMACGNEAVQLIINHLAELPGNIRFMFTTRPDALCGGMESTLRHSFPKLVTIEPWQVREEEKHPESSGEPRVLVYETVVRECLAGVPPRIMDALHGHDFDVGNVPLYSAYHMIFSTCTALSGSGKKRDDVTRLLQVLMAAKEPLSHALLQQMGLADSLPHLPSWGVLFFLADHHVYPMHKSLRDWLVNPKAALEFALDVHMGHLMLGEHLAGEAGKCNGGQPPSSYALKYMCMHLASAVADGHSATADMLDMVLGCWEYLRYVFKVPFAAANLARALGSIPHSCRSEYTDDAFMWTRRLFHDLSAKPDMEHVTLSGCPIKSIKYKEAREKLKPAWVTSVLFGGSGGLWPPDEAILKGHTDWLYSQAYSPDGRQLASASKDHTVRVWNLANGLCTAVLKGHTGTVLSVAFNSSGKEIASGGDDFMVRLWDLASGLCTRVLKGHTSWVYRVAFSPDGRQLGSAATDNTARMWDLTSDSDSFMNLTQHTGFVYGLAYHPGGGVMTTGSKDTTIAVWDTRTGALLKQLTDHESEVFSMSFSGDGGLMASASYDKSVKVWDTTTWKCVQTLKGHMNIVLSVAFSPDASTIASTGSDLTIKLWDVETWECKATFFGHTDACFGVAFSPTGKQLSSCSADKTLRLWDPSRYTGIQGHTSWVHGLCYSPDNKLIASCSRDESIKLWDVATGKCRHTITGHKDVVMALTMKSDGEALYSASLDASIKVWDPLTGECKGTMTGHTKGVISLAISPDSKLLASGSMDTTVRLWNLADLSEVDLFRSHTNTVWTVAFNPRGGELASGAADNLIILWSLVTKEPTGELKGHSSQVTSISYHPNGTQLASGGHDMALKLWDLATRTCLCTMDGHIDQVHSVSFSPDGRRIASGGRDHIINVWDADSGEKLTKLEGHSGWVYGVAFSPDSKSVASCSADGSLRLWGEASY